MDFLVDDEKESRTNRTLEWIVIPVISILTVVAFGYSINGVVIITSWNTQFTAPRIQKTPCDLVRQSWRKFEIYFQMPDEFDWMCCASLGVCTMIMIATISTLRIMRFKASKSYAGICGFNCIMLILLTWTTSGIIYLNHSQRANHIEAELKSLTDVHKTAQLSVLQAFVLKCLKKDMNDYSESFLEFKEDAFSWEDDDGTLIRLSDCYKHCPIENDKILLGLTFTLACLCCLCGIPIIYFIIRQWIARRPLYRDRYEHLQEESDRDGTPKYVLNQHFIVTPNSYSFQHESYYHSSNPAY